MKNRKLNKNEDYLKIRNYEMEVTEEELSKKFDYYLERRYPESLRKTGKRKWKSLFWVLFMFLTSLIIFFLGYWRMISLNEGFKDVIIIFILGTLGYLTSCHSWIFLWFYFIDDFFRNSRF